MAPEGKFFVTIFSVLGFSLAAMFAGVDLQSCFFTEYDVNNAHHTQAAANSCAVQADLLFENFLAFGTDILNWSLEIIRAIFANNNIDLPNSGRIHYQ